MRARLSPALASRPAEQSRALVLAAVYGYTAAEISRAEAIPLAPPRPVPAVGCSSCVLWL